MSTLFSRKFTKPWISRKFSAHENYYFGFQRPLENKLQNWCTCMPLTLWTFPACEDCTVCKRNYFTRSIPYFTTSKFGWTIQQLQEVCEVGFHNPWSSSAYPQWLAVLHVQYYNLQDRTHMTGPSRRRYLWQLITCYLWQSIMFSCCPLKLLMLFVKITRQMEKETRG